MARYQPQPTETEREMLGYIKWYLDQHGYPPCIREIVAHTPTSSTSTASYSLDRLERFGKLKRTRGIARGIVLL